MQDNSRLLNERKSMIETAMSNQKGNNVPVISLCATWAYYYIGKTPKEILYNPALIGDAFRALYKDFYWDGILISRTNGFSPKVIDTLGGGTYQYTEDGVQQTRPGSVNIMDINEYEELIKDPYQFVLEKVFPRRYSLMTRTDDKKYEDMLSVVQDVFGMYGRYGAEDKISEEEFGIPQLLIPAKYNPVDVILDYLRDFQPILGDIKRKPDLVRDAGLALVDFCLDEIMPFQPSVGKALFVPMHLPQFLNAKDFEKVYWPSYKKVADAMAERGFKTIYYFERSYEHLFEFLQDLPAGKTIGLFESDDVRLAKKKLGKTMCVAGGMSTNLLYRGSKQQCIDHAKAIVDETAGDGGYIFTTDMIMLTPSDGKAENLHAVNEFVHEYGKN